MVYEVFAKILPDDISDVALKRYFSRFGEVKKALVRRSKDGNRTFGFVQYAELESCQQCVDASPLIIDEKRVYVVFSNQNEKEFRPSASNETESTCSVISSASADPNRPIEQATLNNRSLAKSPPNSSRSHNDVPLKSSQRQNEPSCVNHKPDDFIQNASVCVTFTEYSSALIYVQTRWQRSKMHELSEKLKESLSPRDRIKPVLSKGRIVASDVKGVIHRCELLEDFTEDSTACRVLFIDIGKRGSAKPYFTFTFPTCVQQPIHPLFTKVRLEKNIEQLWLSCARNFNAYNEICGSSVNIFLPDNPINWFSINSIESDVDEKCDIPCVNLSLKGTPLQDLLKKHNKPNEARDSQVSYNRTTIKTQSESSRHGIGENSSRPFKQSADTTWDDDDSSPISSSKMIDNKSSSRIVPPHSPISSSTEHQRQNSFSRESSSPSAKNHTNAIVARNRFKCSFEEMKNRAVAQDGQFALTHASSFDSVFLCPVDVLCKITLLCDDYAEKIESTSTNLIDYDNPPEINEILMAQYEADMAWYRARVRDVDRKNNELTVLFIDFGNEELVKWTSCRFLRCDVDAEIYKLPRCLVECRLKGANWKTKDIEDFLEHSLNNAYTCHFDLSSMGEKPILKSAINRDGGNLLDIYDKLKNCPIDLTQLDKGGDQINQIVSNKSITNSGTDQRKMDVPCEAAQIERPYNSQCRADSKQKNINHSKDLELSNKDFGGKASALSQRKVFLESDVIRKGVTQGGHYVFTYATSSNNIFLLPTDSMEQIIEACQIYGERVNSENRNIITWPEFPLIGEIVMAQYEDDAWYRAQVLAHHKNSEEVDVFFIDYGNEERVSLHKKCRFLEKEDQFLFDIPYALVNCDLKGHHQWTKLAFEQFSEKVLNRMFICEFELSSPCMITLLSVRDSSGVNILDQRSNTGLSLDEEEDNQGSNANNNAQQKINENDKPLDSGIDEFTNTRQLSSREASVGSRSSSERSQLQKNSNIPTIRNEDSHHMRSQLKKTLECLKCQIKMNRELMEQMQNQIELNEKMIIDIEKLIITGNDNPSKPFHLTQNGY